MLESIIEIQKRSALYVANLNANIVRVIESNQDQIIDANRSQMIGHKDAEGKPLIHSRTGSANLSKAYARRMNKIKPDLFVSGEFQSAMFLTMPKMEEYFISSKDYKTNWLAKNYGNIFGVAPNNQPKVKAKNDKAIIDDYLTIFK